MEKIQWAISPKVDFFAFALPIIISFACWGAIQFEPDDEKGGEDDDDDEGSDVSLKWYIVLVVLVDVAHVWATIFRTYLDSEARQKRWRLFFLSPPCLYLFGVAAYKWSMSAFWSWVAYLAIYHFISQNYGLLAIYKARCGERCRLDYRLDYYALCVGSVGPVLLWHASPTKRFTWFNNGESFMFRLPPLARYPILLVYFGVGVAWIARQARKIWLGKERLNHGKMFIMAMSWFTWAISSWGTDNEVVSLAFLNLFHGMPFFFLVWFVCHRRYEDKQKESLSWTDRLVLYMTESRPSSWLMFYGVLCLLAVLEEVCWEFFHYQVYHDPRKLPSLLSSVIPSESHSAWLVPLLALPQVTHYWLDAFIWKMDGSNVGLREALMLEKPKAS